MSQEQNFEETLRKTENDFVDHMLSPSKIDLKRTCVPVRNAAACPNDKLCTEAISTEEIIFERLRFILIYIFRTLCHLLCYFKYREKYWKHNQPRSQRIEAFRKVLESFVVQKDGAKLLLFRLNGKVVCKSYYHVRIIADIYPLLNSYM